MVCTFFVVEAVSKVRHSALACTLRSTRDAESPKKQH